MLAKKVKLDGILNRDAESGLPIKSNMKLRFSDLRRKKTIDEEVLDKIRNTIIAQGHIVIKNNSKHR